VNRGCESYLNEDGECTRTPELWADWIKLKAQIESAEKEHEGLDLYSSQNLDEA
jgi:hypothetical protein